MTELEKKLKAKIPGEDTGIEVRRSLCAICSPGHHCGVDCYVKDGKIIRVEGTEEHPYNRGKLCTKGSALRNYVYREDRIKTPLRRVGQRGEGKFEPISWDEAYAIIAENLNRVKQRYSANSVAFFSGYCKWYRPIFHRFAHVFGSVNFGTDDSTCNEAKVMGDKCTAGCGAGPDLAHANTYLAWNYEGYYSSHLSVAGVQNLKARGGKVIIIDIRDTPASKNLADIFLKINPGTDGALALGMAKLIIDNGWADMDYVEKYTFGFEKYKELVDQYPLDRVCQITGLEGGQDSGGHPALRHQRPRQHQLFRLRPGAPHQRLQLPPGHRVPVRPHRQLRPAGRQHPQSPHLSAQGPPAFRPGSTSSAQSAIPAGRSRSARPASPCGTACSTSSRAWICCASWRRALPIPSRPFSAWA